MATTCLAAYALVALSNPTPSKDDVKNVLKATNIKVDNEALDLVFSKLAGKSVEALLAEGIKIRGAIGAVAAPAAAAAPSAAAPAAAAAAKPAAKVSEPEPEEEEEGGLGGLFD